jgi:transcriptional regulator with XRE-family HTH domain
MTDWTAVGQRIREARTAKGLTGTQLGEAAGVGDAARISSLESGTRPPTEESLAKVAAVLGVSLPYLRYGVATDADAERLRTAGYSDGWRAALTQLATAADALQAAPPGTPLANVRLPVVGVEALAQSLSPDDRLEAEVEEERALMEAEAAAAVPPSVAASAGRKRSPGRRA